MVSVGNDRGNPGPQARRWQQGQFSVVSKNVLASAKRGAPLGTEEGAGREGKEGAIPYREGEKKKPAGGNREFPVAGGGKGPPTVGGSVSFRKNELTAGWKKKKGTSHSAVHWGPRGSRLISNTPAKG